MIERRKLEDDDQARTFEEDFEEFDELPHEAADREKQRVESLRMNLKLFGEGLEVKAEEQERLRRPIEDRWISDIRQYKGFYDDEKMASIIRGQGSKQFVNITRKKTNAGEAKCSDMVFPTDDRNWGIRPTPIPELVSQQEAAVDTAAMTNGVAAPQPMQQQVQSAAGGSYAEAMQPPPQPQPGPGQQAPGQPGPAGMMPPPGAPVQPAARSANDIAKERCEKMKDLIDDQLKEANYEAKAREAIHSAFLLGTGVLKGPEIHTNVRKAWVKKEDGKGNSVHVLDIVEETTPGVSFVDLWDFFPDMTATRIDDAEFVFVRHWMTKRDLIRLSRRPDFIKENIVEVMGTAPNRVPPTYLMQLRELSGLSNVGDEKRYVVWEYHGPVSKENLMLCGVDVDQENELDEYEGVVWVCQGIVIKAQVNPMDTEERPFSVFCLEKDDSSIFGFGIPYLMRSPQEVVNAAWRMIMDNAGLSVGGQIIINDSIIEPVAGANGKMDWNITPLKLWRMKKATSKPSDAFHIFEFPNHQQELSNIFQMARQLADEESGVPVIAEGEGGGGLPGTNTLGGMELLMNNHQIVMRRAVKNWDDDVTRPMISRFYDHNMQFSEDENVKGDYVVDARGTAFLLQKETQARNILNLANFAQSPALAGWFKFKPIAETLTTTMQLEKTEFVNTEEEYQANLQAQQQAAAQQGQGGKDPQAEQMRMQIEQQKLQLSYQMHQEKLAEAKEDRQFRAWEIQQKIQIETIKLAQAKELTVTQIEGMLRNTALKGKIDRTKLADEARVKVEFGSGL